jgi:N-ethylmaleimide reductase
MFTATGPKDIPVPRALAQGEIAETVGDFRRAARSAIEAGADGVELHGANGYLIHQFLSENANQRTDAYGGSIGNRIRFAIEVAAGVANEIGADRTGIRLSPGVSFNDIVEGDTAALYRALIAELVPLELAYVHLLHVGDDELLRWIRPRWPRSVIVNRPGRAREQIATDIDAGLADLASVATFALANPDLVARLKANAALNEPDRSTFYGGTERGYTDYPVLGS